MRAAASGMKSSLFHLAYHTKAARTNPSLRHGIKQRSRARGHLYSYKSRGRQAKLRNKRVRHAYKDACSENTCHCHCDGERSLHSQMLSVNAFLD